MKPDCSDLMKPLGSHRALVRFSDWCPSKEKYHSGNRTLPAAVNSSTEARFALFISLRFSENLRKRQVRNANSMQHLRFSEK